MSFLLANDKSTIDKAHTHLSKQTESFLSGVDEYFVAFLDYISTATKSKISQENPNSSKIDKLFQNEKYINQTQDSFLLLSSDYVYNSLEKDELNSALRGKIALNQSSHRLKIFFNSLRKDINNPTNNKSEVGLSYLGGIKEGVDIQYSLGARSLNPYVSARISYDYKAKDWLITPEQYLEYSFKDDFKESSTIYLDRKIYEDILFRLQLQRSTKSKENGMAYNSSIAFFWTPRSDTGLRFSQSFFGNTGYKTDKNRKFKGVNNYQTKFILRQNIFRKWFFYELSPAVNFAEENNFEPNYSLFLRFDIFFGADKYM